MDKGYVFIKMSASPWYGQEIEEGFFVSKPLFDKHKDSILAVANGFSWHERAGKHSETDVENVDVITVTEENHYDLSMIDTQDYIEEMFYDYEDFTEEDISQLIEDKKFRLAPRAMVTITKERYDELLRIEDKFQTMYSRRNGYSS